jgi:hypothetical protein
MTPQAAGIVAQVDAALLIALTITTVTAPQSGQDSENGAVLPSRAGIYVLGICGVLLSLNIALASVVFNKPLTGLAEHVASDSVMLGFLPLFMTAIDRLLPEFSKKALRGILLVAVLLAALIWSVIWWESYAPGGLFS